MRATKPGFRTVGHTRCIDNTSDGISETWIERETAGSLFKDERLGHRFKTLLQQIGGAIGGSIPLEIGRAHV